ncbi:MAG: hypothetical protein Kow0029_07930 [Candidatus Rifleibacteriota bacterium]
MVFRLFVASVIVLLIFLGCGGGGGGGSSVNPIGPSVVSGRIYGTIIANDAVASTRNYRVSSASASISANAQFLDSLISVEELNYLNTSADNLGRFEFTNLTPGTYHLLGKITSLSGRRFKKRTSAITLSEGNLEQQVNLVFTSTDLANSRIRLQIKDLNGNLVGRCRVSFWGEEFTIDSSNYYLSPEMPIGAIGQLKIIPPADKELASLTYTIGSEVFKDNYVSVFGYTLPTSGITNRAPIAEITIQKNPNDGSAFLRLEGLALDLDGDPLATSWKTNVSTFTYMTQTHADWVIPSTSASAAIYFTVSENGFRYPRLTTTAKLDVNVASSGIVTFPDEVVIEPVTRTTDIFGTATAQIPGDTVALFEARPQFPAGLGLIYSWSVDEGLIIAGQASSTMIWRSPSLALGETVTANINLEVSDGVEKATKQLSLRVTSTPLAIIEKPVETAFEPGFIEFFGRARDYLNTAIPPTSFKWYVATGTSDFALQKTGVATFTYFFATKGSYTVALQCTDSDGSVGTGTKEISIINARPVCSIISPANDSTFLKNTAVTFNGVVNDYEDGPITDPAAISWSSDIDGILGSGTNFVLPALSSGKHTIRLSAYDSGGAIGSASVIVWYDVPARITFLPADGSVIFAGSDISFVASGTDSDGTALDSSSFKWYIDDLPEIWKEGASFTIAAGTIASGTHLFRVEGLARLGSVVSPTNRVEIAWPLPNIVSPASGTRFDPGTAINFAATPDSTGTLNLYWYLNNEQASFGSGANVTYSPVNGSHQITYSGIDSQGFAASSTIGIVVERPPIISFQPIDGAYIFGGRNIGFNAICLDSDNNDIADDKVQWLLDGVPWQTGKAFSAQQGSLPGQLATGAHAVMLAATGPYGTTATVTHNLNTGIDVAKITAPPNDSTYTSGSVINFTGVPDNVGLITMEWWLNIDTAPTLLGNGNTLITSALPDGYHSITYVGTDSTGFVSRDTIYINIGQFPTMDFTPNDSTAFFANQTVNFVGVGTDTLTGLPIPANKMAWYIDGAPILASFSSFPVDPVIVNTVGAGLRAVELRGTNSINAVGKVIKNIYLGVKTASITSPLNDTVIPTATMYSFTGEPDNTGPLTMEWWLDYGQAGASNLGNGSSLNAIIPDGIHYLTYIGTDSGGLVSSASIRVIISDSPAISFTPSDGSRLFVGQPFDLTIGGAVEPTSVKWYRSTDVTPWKTGSPVTVNVGELPVGVNQIKAEGENLLGVSSEITNNIYYGVELASITAPASGTVYNIGATVSLSGVPTPVAPIDMHWYRDDGSGPVYMGNTANLTTSTIPPGLHTITYIGTDSANFSSSSEIQIILDDPPTMDFTPGNGARFFAGSSIVFTGVGTGSIAAFPVDSSTMNWYLDGSAVAIRSGSPMTLDPADLITGNRTLKLTGRDQYNVEGQVTYSFYYGHALADITVPASGASYSIGSTVNFTGTPDTTGPITMNWYEDFETAGEAFLGTGANISHTFATRGIKTITYVGTDSAGIASKKTIQILINDSPTMTIATPVNGGKYFGGQILGVSGSGLDVNSSPINSSTFVWYLDGSPWKTGVANFSATVADLGTGTINIRLDGSDDFGTTGTVTNVVTTGFDLPSITAPASGTRYAIGSNVNFTGFPDTSPPITLYWYLDYGLPGETQFGTGQNASYNFATRGLKRITYLATDSANTLRKSDIQIIVNNLPTVTMVAPVNSGKYFGGQSVTFTCSGTDSGGSPLDVGNYKWFRDGVNFKTGLDSFAATIAELPTGTRQIGVQGKDDLGDYNGATYTIEVGFSLPTITSPASGSTYSIGSNVNFTATPDNSAPITFYWYIDYGLPGETQFGTGQNASYNFATRGLKTITYLATDSANTLRMSTIQIVVNDSPTVNIVTPVNNGKYFGGQTLNFSGNGTDSGGGALPTANYKWYRDGINFKSAVDSFIATIAELPTGTRDISLQGKDEFGAVSGATVTVELGISLPTISSPASGTRYDNGATVNFSGSPDSTGPITMQWYENFELPGENLLGAGANISYLFGTRGLKNITYVGTDSAGTAPSKTIQILIDSRPTMTITAPVNNGYYFGNQNIAFSGSGLDSGGGAITVASMKWYKNGALWKSATDNFSATVTELPTGTYQISLGGADEFNVWNSATYTIQVGLDHPNITSPASGTRFDTGTNISFTGTPDLTGMLATEWYWVEDGSVFGTGPTASIATFTRGWQTVVFRGTDSQGSTRSSTIMILIDKLPTFTVSPYISSPAKFSDGPQYNMPTYYIPIHLASPGQSVDFSVVAKNELGAIIPPADIYWYESGTLIGNVATLSRNFATPGSFTYDIEIRDDYGQSSTASFTFWVWDTETYSSFVPAVGPGTLNAPSALLGYDNSTMFAIDSGNSRIVRLTRATVGISQIGDLTTIAAETDVASCTHPFVDIAVTGGVIYSLGNNTGTDYRIQSWLPTDLRSSTRDYTIVHGALDSQLNDPQGMCVDANAIYVSDTGNNKIKKLDITNGVFYSQSKAVDVPKDIGLINATTLCVAENNTDKMLRFVNDLNSVATWQSQAANNCTNFVYSSTTGNLYITDPTIGNPKVHVIDASGNLIYSFGKNGNTPNQGEFQEPLGITIIQNDLYISDKTSNFIVRFRTGTW